MCSRPSEGPGCKKAIVPRPVPSEMRDSNPRKRVHNGPTRPRATLSTLIGSGLCEETPSVFLHDLRSKPTTAKIEPTVLLGGNTTYTYNS